MNGTFETLNKLHANVFLNTCNDNILAASDKPDMFLNSAQPDM